MMFVNLTATQRQSGNWQFSGCLSQACLHFAKFFPSLGLWKTEMGRRWTSCQTILKPVMCSPLPTQNKGPIVLPLLHDCPPMSSWGRFEKVQPQAPEKPMADPDDSGWSKKLNRNPCQKIDLVSNHFPFHNRCGAWSWLRNCQTMAAGGSMLDQILSPYQSLSWQPMKNKTGWDAWTCKTKLTGSKPSSCPASSELWPWGWSNLCLGAFLTAKSRLFQLHPWKLGWPFLPIFPAMLVPFLWWSWVVSAGEVVKGENKLLDLNWWYSESTFYPGSTHFWPESLGISKKLRACDCTWRTDDRKIKATLMNDEWNTQ